MVRPPHKEVISTSVVNLPIVAVTAAINEEGGGGHGANRVTNGATLK